MPSLSVVFPRLALAAALAVLALHVPEASAQSKRDRAAAAELAERMAAAESRYRESLVKAANADPEAIAQGDAALEDMEDVMLDCEKQRGCQVSTLMPAFKRLLKAQADEASGAEGEDSCRFLRGRLPPAIADGAMPRPCGARTPRFHAHVAFTRRCRTHPRWLTTSRVAHTPRELPSCAT